MPLNIAIIIRMKHLVFVFDINKLNIILIVLLYFVFILLFMWVSTNAYIHVFVWFRLHRRHYVEGI